MEKLQMRRCSSLDWRPSPVVALASSFDASRVAAVREDATLEIWLVAPGSVGWHCLLTIAGNPASRLSSLVWSRPTSQSDTFGRLLSSSLDGSVFEWDISSLKQKKILDSMSMSIWQMALEPNDSSVISNPKQLSNGHVLTKADVHSESESSIVGDDDDDSDDEASSTYVGATYQRLAVACDDGSIRLYNVPETDALNYLRSFPRVNGKMLSVTWSHDAKFIFSGSSDGIIRCWDVRSFQEKYRITAGLGGVGSGPNLCIWSLLSLRCGTLVSGDSSGSIQFWDSCHGTLVQAQRHHKGDVLALAAAPNHNRVFSAGSDGQVILYKLSKEEINKDETSKWVYVGYVRAHTHDVRALAVAVPISREDASVDEGKATKVRKKDKPIEYSYHKWAHLGVPMLISSGDDAKLFAYSAMEFTNFAPHDICPAPQRPLVNFTNERSNDGGAQIMLTQQCTRLDMKLSEHVTGNMKRIPTQPSHLQLKSEGSRRIVCSAISGVIHHPIPISLESVALSAPSISMALADDKKKKKSWNWENAAAGAIAGFTTVASLHPLDVVRTRLQVSDGRTLPLYRHTAHALFSIGSQEGLRGLYAGFSPAVFGSSLSWGLYFFFYNRAKQRYSAGSDDHLTPTYHLVSAAEAGALVSLCTNPIWLVKTRLQLQVPTSHSRPYSGFYDAMRTIVKEEGWLALYRGLGPSLFLVTHGAIQFTVYEELKKAVIYIKRRDMKSDSSRGEELLNSFDYATLGAASKIAAMLLTYPYQVIRTRLQQRPSRDGVPKYLHSWHVVKETTRFEGFRGFYKGITSNLLKNIPSASITFVVYENVLKLIQVSRG